MELDLDGRIAVVTGGSRGIGRATAAQLVAEGANVAVCARDEPRLRRAVEEIDAAGPGRAIGIRADAREASDLQAFVDQTIDRFRGLDIVVNNVGSSARRPFLEADTSLWEDDLRIKLFSAIELSRYALPRFPDRGGRIINVLSIGGKQPAAASGPTSVTRAAGLALTKALSKEFAPQKVLVNAVCVGLIRSGQHEDRRQRESPDLSEDEFYAAAAQKRGIPLGRAGEAQEVANVITFLASGAASFVSGTALNVDGAQCHAT
jgi:3-oxoacyl-[acyl-carrier protein] reductase